MPLHSAPPGPSRSNSNERTNSRSAVQPPNTKRIFEETITTAHDSRSRSGRICRRQTTTQPVLRYTREVPSYKTIGSSRDWPAFRAHHLHAVIIDPKIGVALAQSDIAVPFRGVPKSHQLWRFGTVCPAHVMHTHECPPSSIAHQYPFLGLLSRP